MDGTILLQASRRINRSPDFSLQEEDSFLECSSYPQDHWDDDIQSDASPEWTVSLEDKKWIQLFALKDTSFAQADFDESDHLDGKEPF